MQVTFRKTGDRRYAVLVQADGMPPQLMNPAPGFDPYIPHDLVHYVVEAELSLKCGVYGRAAGGGGTFYPDGDAVAAGSARERARARRKQTRRERQLRSNDDAERELQLSERLAGLCDLLWRRRHGQQPDPSRRRPDLALPPTDAARARRVVDRLDQLAVRWNALPVGGELRFVWPSVMPAGASAPATDAQS